MSGERGERRLREMWKGCVTVGRWVSVDKEKLRRLREEGGEEVGSSEA